MKKRFLKIGTVMLFLLFNLSVFEVAAENRTPQVFINGGQVEFDVEPIIDEGRTLIPIRAVSEQLGYQVVWDSSGNSAEIKSSDDTLELFMGKRKYFKNGIEKQMDVSALVISGRTMVPLRLIAEEFGCTVRWLPEKYTVEIVRYETVNVHTAKELLEEIGSYKKIVLSEGEYNLSKVENRAVNDFIAEVDWGDGTEYNVIEVKDLIIQGEENKNVTVVIEPRYANVLSFGKCEHITLKNITMGHTIAPGLCLGGVVRLDSCDDVSMDNLKLFGCGTCGVIAEKCTNINVKNTEIYECTYELIDIVYSQNVVFDNCIFRDTQGYDMFYIDYSENVKICNSVIKNNKSGVYFNLVSVYNSENVCFENCDFKENAYFKFSTDDDIFENCRGVNNKP